MIGLHCGERRNAGCTPHTLERVACTPVWARVRPVHAVKGEWHGAQLRTVACHPAHGCERVRCGERRLAAPATVYASMWVACSTVFSDVWLPASCRVSYTESSLSAARLNVSYVD